MISLKISPNARASAAQILFAVMEDGVSLGDVIKPSLPDRALVQQLCYGCLRSYFLLSSLLQPLLSKSIKKKDRILHYLLLVGIYQIRDLNIPNHAAVSETVAAVNIINKSWAKGLVNAVLRNYLRQQDDLVTRENEEVLFNHPQWLIDKIKLNFPLHWQAILKANSERAPMCLRVNARLCQRDDYISLLQQHDIHATPHPIVDSAIVLDAPCDVKQLPGFYDGLVSVQDASAQYCGFLLPLADSSAVLDACSAPGGKACHLLERFTDLRLTAIDISEIRNKLTQENLSRLQLSAQLLSADACDLDTWWDGERFDGILLDAPCSATGVIRRHPDIKFLRRENDFKALANTQLNLLQHVWQTLKPGGHLLFATCSIMSEENDGVIEKFLQQQSSAMLITLKLNIGHATKHGWQILPGEEDMDGFYYCLFQHECQ